MEEEGEKHTLENSNARDGVGKKVLGSGQRVFGAAQLDLGGGELGPGFGQLLEGAEELGESDIDAIGNREHDFVLACGEMRV